MTDIKKGDRVKVTIEGAVYDAGGRDTTVGTGILNSVIFPKVPGDGLSVTVEKIDPPMEVFKPGDIVRRRFSQKDIYFIRPRGGFANLTTKREYDYPFTFTSEDYERVDLSAVTG